MALQGTKATIDGSGINSIALGDAISSSTNTIAIGYDVVANGNNSICIGQNASSYPSFGNSIVIGAFAQVYDRNCIAIGYNAKSGNDGA